MLKTNHRYNGTLPSIYSNNDQLQCTDEYKTVSMQNHNSENETNIAHANIISNNKDLSLNNKIVSFKNSMNLLSNIIIKEEPNEELEEKLFTSSIIDVNHANDYKVNNKLNATSKFKTNRNGGRSTYHESLQRIGGGDPSYNHYQQHWFSSSLERLKFEDKSREERLEITRYELRRQLKQIMKSNLGKLNISDDDNDDAPDLGFTSSLQRLSSNSGYNRLVSTKLCDIDNCKRRALPCTRYCTHHIMHNQDQVLFDYCTAKFADNTQCSIPIFDITHELPLCPEHARKRDNYKMYQETKPKKLRKKVKPSAMIRPQKRNKKKRRLAKLSENTLSIVENKAIVEEICHEAPDLASDMVEQVLALQEPDGLELAVEQALVTQASTLLEESEINTVLSTIQAGEFDDFFTAVNHNGQYEPTREETEELERALAAVDNDVKSLEKLSQSQGLLDSFLDEGSLVESLVQIPDVFHNGYVPCGDNIVAHTSRLLSVEPHSQT